MKQWIKDNKPYEEALKELEAIVSEIEGGETELDTLSEKIKRASKLLQYCKHKLTQTNVEVEQILKELQD